MRAAKGTVGWLGAYYAALDSGNTDELKDFLHPDCRSHYATGTTDIGRSQILERTAKALERLAGIRHVIEHVWEDGDMVIFELEVTYRRRDGTRISRPGMGIFVRQDGLIREQRLFVNDTAVWRATRRSSCSSGGAA